MKLEWNIEHWDYHKATYEVWKSIVTFEIDYHEATDQYTSNIDRYPYGPWNTYREAQLFCEGYLEWMLEFQYKVKKHLSDLLAD